MVGVGPSACRLNADVKGPFNAFNSQFGAEKNSILPVILPEMRACDKGTVINPTSSRVNMPCLEMSGKTNVVRQTHPATNDLHSPTIILRREKRRW